VENILSNPEIQKIAKDFGEIYLNEGNTLLHGDFYPASWLQSKNKTSIIDPEFCLLGVPEFDLSVTVAHFILSRQSMDKISHFLKSYNRSFNKDYVNSFASLEIIRRLTYVAQLPLVMKEDEKYKLLEKAVRVLKRESSWI
jgi:5-methylthioribose kinase